MKKLLFVFSLILVSLLLVSCFPGQEQDETINLTIQPDSSSFISEYDGHTVNWNKIEYSLFYNGNFLKEGDLTVNEISGPFVFSNLVSGNYEVNIRVINDGFVIAKIQKSFNLTKDNNTFNASYEMMDSNLEIEVTDNRSDKSLDVTHNIIISNESGIIAEDSITNEATSNLVFNPGLYTLTINQITTENDTTISATTVVEKSNFYSPGYKYVSTLEITDDSVDLSDPETPVDPEDPDDYDVDLSFDISDAVAIASNSEEESTNSLNRSRYSIPDNYGKVLTLKDLKTKSSSSNKLVKILTDGSIESIMNLPEGYNPPEIAYVSTEEDGSVYIIFRNFLSFNNGDRRFTAQFIRVFPDNEFQVLWPLDPFINDPWNEGNIEVRNDYYQEGESVLKADNGYIYFKTNNWKNDGEKNNIYEYRPNQNNTPELVTPDYKLRIRRFKADVDGNIYIEFSMGGNSQFKVYKDGTYYESNIYYSNTDYANNIQTFIPQREKSGIVANGSDIRGKNGIVRIDIETDNYEKDFDFISVFNNNHNTDYRKYENNDNDYIIEEKSNDYLRNLNSQFSFYEVDDSFYTNDALDLDKINAFISKYSTDTNLEITANDIEDIENWEKVFYEFSDSKDETTLRNKEIILKYFFNDDEEVYNNIKSLLDKTTIYENKVFFDESDSYRTPDFRKYEWKDTLKNEDGSLNKDFVDFIFRDRQFKDDEIEYLKNWSQYHTWDTYNQEDPLYDFYKKIYDKDYRNIVDAARDWNVSYDWFFDEKYIQTLNLYQYDFITELLASDGNIDFSKLEKLVSYSMPKFSLSQENKDLLNSWDGYYSQDIFTSNYLDSMHLEKFYEFYSEDLFTILNDINSANDHSVLTHNDTLYVPEFYYFEWSDFMYDDMGNLDRELLSYFLMNFDANAGVSRDSTQLSYQFTTPEGTHIIVDLIKNNDLTDEAYNAFLNWNNYLPRYYSYNDSYIYPAIDDISIYKYAHYLYEYGSKEEKLVNLTENVLIPITEKSTSTTYEIRDVYLDDAGNIKTNTILKLLENPYEDYTETQINLLNNWDGIFHNDWESFEETSTEYKTHYIVNEILENINEISLDFLTNAEDKNLKSMNYYRLKWDSSLLNASEELDETKFNNFISYFDGIIDSSKYSFEEVQNWNMYYRTDNSYDGEYEDPYGLLNSNMIEKYKLFISPLNNNILKKTEKNYKTFYVRKFEFKDKFYDDLGNLSEEKLNYLLDLYDLYGFTYDRTALLEEFKNWNEYFYYIYDRSTYEKEFLNDEISHFFKNIRYDNNNIKANLMAEIPNDLIDRIYYKVFTLKDKFLNEDTSVNQELVNEYLSYLPLEISEEMFNEIFGNTEYILPNYYDEYTDSDNDYIKEKYDTFSKYYSDYSSELLYNLSKNITNLNSKSFGLFSKYSSLNTWSMNIYEFDWNPDYLNADDTINKEKFTKHFNDYFIDGFNYIEEEKIFENLNNWDGMIYRIDNNNQNNPFYKNNVEPKFIYDFAVEYTNFINNYFDGILISDWLRDNVGNSYISFYNIKELFYDSNDNLYAMYSNTWGDSLDGLSIFKLMNSNSDKDLDYLTIEHTEYAPSNVEIKGDYIYYIHSEKKDQSTSYKKIARLHLTTKETDNLLDISGMPKLDIYDYDVTSDNSTMFLSAIDWSKIEDVVIKVDLVNGTFTKIPSNMKLDSIKVF
ncbi:hypothetical protein [Geotoga petraea]|uniref:Uncharacterized protein n=1 Tax=Geotoga petraea TaxID=28234 RepID=A0A1G6PK45_9BACT|nr:hypothetical protein [Geotoga petraea]SDC80438.1 hypothetical protein SAMN04488588_1836 [Geotoga petraea]